MAGLRVANRYSSSLLDLSQDQGKAEKVFEDMKLISQTLNENRHLKALLKNPVIKEDKKISILKEIFSRKISELSMNFITLVVKKRREYFLSDMADAFITDFKVLKGITTAIISTASGLDDNLRSRVIELVKKDGETEVELVEKVNPDLIGGFILRYGNIQYDTSVSRSLRGLRRNFSKNLYIGKIKNK